ncbi:hypothetical protein [Flagellimonas sp. 2504JD1-5]
MKYEHNRQKKYTKEQATSWALLDLANFDIEILNECAITVLNQNVQDRISTDNCR